MSLRSRAIAASGLAFLIAMGVTAADAKSDSIEQSGKVLAYALPAAAGAISLFANDEDGDLQLGVSYLLTMGVSYGLKEVVHEERPDHSDDHSFPSASTASAFAGAAYLDKRYGWKFGLPAYAIASYVGYSRVESKQHHWYDAAAGAAIGWGFNQMITREDEVGGVEVHPLVSADFLGLGFDLHW